MADTPFKLSFSPLFIGACVSTLSRADRPRKSFEEMVDTRIQNLRKELQQKIRAGLIRAVIEKVQKNVAKLSASDKIRFELMAEQMHADLYIDRHRDLCKLMEVEPTQSEHSKDWRGASMKMFDGNPLGLMIAMVLMHRYHPGHYSGPDGDPLKPLLSVYKVDAAAIGKRIKGETSEKVASIQASLKRSKAKLPPEKSAAVN